jgi:hypothetical protein
MTAVPDGGASPGRVAAWAGPAAVTVAMTGGTEWLRV